MAKDEYKSIISRYDTLQKTVDELRARWDDEHKDVMELAVRQGKVEARLEGIEDALHIQKKEINETVKNTIQDEIKPVQDQMDEFTNKKVVYQKINKRWFQFWKRKE